MGGRTVLGGIGGCVRGRGRGVGRRVWIDFYPPLLPLFILPYILLLCFHSSFLCTILYKELASIVETRTLGKV